MKEDKNIARKLVEAEVDETLKTFRAIGMETVVVNYANYSMLGDPPPDGGAGTMVPIHIGMRGELSKGQARIAGKAWLEITGLYPKACFAIALLGYDEDPRPIWEIPEAARYVRWWAKYSGVDNFETAQRLIGETSALAELGPGHDRYYIGFLIACGVFGPEAQQEVIKDFPPMKAN